MPEWDEEDIGAMLEHEAKHGHLGEIQPPEEAREPMRNYTGWLIERNENGYAEWLVSLIESPLRWTREAHTAILLETEEQAHREISRLRIQRSGDFFAIPTEHAFIVTSPEPPPVTEGRDPGGEA